MQRDAFEAPCSACRYSASPSSAFSTSSSRDHVGGDLEAVVVGILVLPEPGVAGRLDGQVRLGIGILQIEQLERGDRDHDQDQDRDHRPGDLERRCGASSRDGVGLALSLKRTITISQQDQHEHRDRDDDDVDEIVEPIDLAPRPRSPGPAAPLPGRRLAGARRSDIGATMIAQRHADHRRGDRDVRSIMPVLAILNPLRPCEVRLSPV